MLDDDYVTIGQFAELSGLSVHTLRHWNSVDLLVPALVDENSRYRHYHRSQLPLARRIATLRAFDLPIDEIRQLQRDDDQAAQASVLQHHRLRLMEQRERITVQLAALDQLIAKESRMPPPVNGYRPTQIRLPALDLDRTAAFYEHVFAASVVPGGASDDQRSRTIVFNAQQASEPFLLVLLGDQQDLDCPNAPGTIGVLVDDLDAVHQRALDAGGTELVAVHAPEPGHRCSAVADPARNWIWLDQSPAT